MIFHAQKKDTFKFVDKNGIEFSRFDLIDKKYNNTIKVNSWETEEIFWDSERYNIKNIKK